MLGEFQKDCHAIMFLFHFSSPWHRQKNHDRHEMEMIIFQIHEDVLLSKDVAYFLRHFSKNVFDILPYPFLFLLPPAHPCYHFVPRKVLRDIVQ